MSTIIQKSVYTTFVIMATLECAYSQDANDILKKMDEVMFSTEDMTGTMKVVMTDKNGKQEIREATFRQKGNDMRLFRFTSPASQAGIAVLSLPDDVMYLYLPAYGRERRIASSAKNQNFAGTDFSYDDMESKSYSAKYTPKLLNTLSDSYVLELNPKQASDYSRIVVNVNKIEYYPESMDFYDRGNNKIKEAKYIFKKIGNYWNSSDVEMTNLKTGRKTSMQMSNIKYDVGLTEEDFTVRKLKQ